MAKSKTTQRSKVKAKTNVKVNAKRFEEVKDDIIRLDGEVERNFVDLAELLYEAAEKKHYEDWGYDSVWDFCDVELMTHSRKARYLVKIYEKIVEFGIPKKRAAKIGWTKLKSIIVIMTKKNMEALLEQAEKLSTAALEKKVETARGRQSGDVPKIVTLKFKMGEADGNIVTDALNEAKGMSDSTDPSIWLVMICQDWLSEKGALPERTSLEDIIAYAEKMYGVKLDWKIKSQKTKKDSSKDDEDLLEEDLDSGLEEEPADDDLGAIDEESKNTDSDIGELDFEDDGTKDLEEDGDEVDIDKLLTEP